MGESARIGSVLQRREYTMPKDAGVDIYRLEDQPPKQDTSDARRPKAPECRDVSKPVVKDADKKAESQVPSDLHEQMLRQIRRMNSHLLHSICNDIGETPSNVFDDGEKTM